ncbi:MAG: glucan biosynthesis protein D [Sneathiellaceae bacterium]
MNRRQTLATLAGLAAAGFLPRSLLAAVAAPPAKGAGPLVLGPPEPFSFARLKAEAQAAAGQPWQKGPNPNAAVLERIDYDAFQAIRFRKAAALWADGGGGDPVQLFHLGRYFQDPATIHVIEDGTAREILYRQAYFDMPDDHVARTLPEDIGFAGFRISLPEQDSDWVAFLGASYFRTAGARGQYGLSARGLAIDTGLDVPEEFPRFTGFWLERIAGEQGRVIVYARLDSPSIAGAYRIDCRNRGDGGGRPEAGGVEMDIDCALYPRKPIRRLGIAPLTSMFWYGETDRRKGPDWRPEIHDSDGLAIWTGGGERIWRPLKNPPQVMTNSFQDTDPKGFGLLQRDRDFENYQDDGVFYDRRPSLWVAPKGGWGKGQVQLVEIPTTDEIHDNIVAYWVPDGPVDPGRSLDYGYKLFWDGPIPGTAPLGHAVASYAGSGGVPGQPRPKGVTRFVVDFEGSALAELARGEVEPVVTLSRGTVGLSDAHPVAGRPGRLRAFFEVTAPGAEPVDMRLFLRGAGLRQGDGALTETWLYQYFPVSEGY